jgi:hypothetical protein
MTARFTHRTVRVNKISLAATTRSGVGQSPDTGASKSPASFVPYMHPRQLADCTKDWTACSAYALDHDALYATEAIDTGDWLRSRQLCADSRFIRMARALGWYLAGTVVVGCGWLVVAGLL